MSHCVISSFSLPPDPYHERARANIVFFDKMVAEDPVKYNTDTEERRQGEGEGKEEGEGREEMSEHERYESLCRAPWPIVSAAGWLWSAVVTRFTHSH